MFALLVPALIGAFATAMGSLAFRALLALGFGFVTYKGIDVGIAAIKAQVITGVNSLPGDALALVGYLWMDKALSVVFSAVAASLAMRALGGTVKRLVAK